MTAADNQYPKASSKLLMGTPFKYLYWDTIMNRKVLLYIK